MLRRIVLAVLFFMSFQSQSFAGIIGVGGTNALENPEVLERLNSAEEVSVESAVYHRISARIGAQGSATAEIENNRKEMEKAEFIKVYLNSEPSIVDTNFRMKLKNSN
ncbi:MAG: hypothetical protein EOP07_01810 [Proteobacteria bacterium]|nr:MAG: hypothetical protein EOP07_01810 [Pseudomonadota bacterium]